MTTTFYDDSFYLRLAVESRRSAAKVVKIIGAEVMPSSVLDVGCGVGAWLAEWSGFGVTDLQGLDGDYIDRALLQIDPAIFRAIDLSQAFDLGRRFDLVQCLEVAEHLKPEDAGTLIDSLVRHGDVVLFSAAIPGQGGTQHLNEQWPTYWEAQFKRRGLRSYDSVRWSIWWDSDISWVYRQNLVLYAKDPPAGFVERPVIDVVHPEGWDLVRQHKLSGRQHLLGLIRAIRARIWHVMS